MIAKKKIVEDSDPTRYSSRLGNTCKIHRCSPPPTPLDFMMCCEYGSLYFGYHGRILSVGHQSFEAY